MTKADCRNTQPGNWCREVQCVCLCRLSLMSRLSSSSSFLLLSLSSYLLIFSLPSLLLLFPLLFSHLSSPFLSSPLLSSPLSALLLFSSFSLSFFPFGLSCMKFDVVWLNRQSCSIFPFVLLASQKNNPDLLFLDEPGIEPDASIK